MNLERIAGGLALLVAWALLVVPLARRDRLIVEVELATRTPAALQLFVDAGDGFSARDTVRQPLVPDGAWHRLELAVAVSSPVTAIRLDPLDLPGSCSIREIRLAASSFSSTYRGAALSAWRPGGGARVTLADGDLVLVAPRGDSQLTLSSLRGPRGSPPFSGVALLLLLLPLPILGLTLARRAAGAAWGEAVALATPLLAFLTINWRALGSWWSHDDPCLIGAAVRFGIGPHFWDPAVWRALSGSVLMPWNVLSLAVDRSLFGLRPAAFYLHGLLSFGVLLILLHGFLRSFLSRAATCLALTALACSAASFAVVQQLMNRHYVEGLVFATAALWLYRRSVAEEKLSPAVAGALGYALAVTAKEVFVPLILLLPSIPQGTLRQRLRSLLPFAAVALVYGPWRVFLLGWSGSFSGYAPRPVPARLADLLAPLGVSHGWQGLLLVALAVAAAGLAVRRSRAVLPLLVVAAVGVLAPLVPIRAELAARHFLLPILLLVVLVSWLLEPLLAARPMLAAVASLAVLAASLLSLTESPLWRRHDRSMAHYRAEGSFLLDASRPGTLLTSLEDSQFLPCLARLGVASGTSPAALRYCGDACWCLAESSPARWVWDGAEVRPLASSPTTSCSEARPLTVELSYAPASGKLSWLFGPYGDRQGSYSVLLFAEHGVAAPALLAARGSIPYALAGPLRLVVRFQSREGWRTYSPVLQLDPQSGRVEWQRAAGVGAP